MILTEEEVSRKEREEMVIKKAKRRALSTAMMRELRTEYSEAPEEVRDDMNLHRFKQSKEDKHRTEYEEDNFKRLILSKEEKASLICASIEKYKLLTSLVPPPLQQCMSRQATNNPMSCTAP